MIIIVLYSITPFRSAIGRCSYCCCYEITQLRPRQLLD